jgi:N-acetylmuramoyl-L-alanine amidase
MNATVSSTDVANRLHGHVRNDPTTNRTTISGSGHQVVLQPGTSVAIVDGRTVILDQPVRMENGMLRASSQLMNAVPTPAPAPVVPARGSPGTVAPSGRADPNLALVYGINHIVIDPGHGGRDPGAHRAGVREKDINLDVALAVAGELRRSGMRVTMTRDSDVYVALEERSRIANAAHPDIFVSIHTNAAKSERPHGVELFVLGNPFTHKSKRYDDRSRAQTLNRQHATLGGTHVTAAQLAQHRKDGRALGGHIEKRMTSQLAVTSRGVKPASFSVLKWTCSPAVLVEVGFLSNRKDLAQLADPAYRRRIAHAIAQGVLDYREKSRHTRLAAKP